MIIWFIIVGLLILFIPAFIDGYTGNRKYAKYYGVKPEETTEDQELQEINKQERINILDQTIVKYNHLLDSLAQQLETETDEKKRAALIAKQITTLEKYNKALEKMEKLDN